MLPDLSPLLPDLTPLLIPLLRSWDLPPFLLLALLPQDCQDKENDIA